MDSSPPAVHDETPADDWPDRATITDPAAVALLTDIRGARMVAPFLRQAMTQTEAARALGRPASSVAHWIPRMVRCGVIERRGEIRRAGAAMPVYRAPARTLVVRFQDVPFDARVRFLDHGRMRVLRRFLDGMDEVLAASPSVGLAFRSHGEVGIAVELDEHPPTRPSLSTDAWGTMSLSDTDARAFSRELEDLVARYSNRGGPRRFVVHAGIVPEPTFAWRSADDTW